MKVDAPRLCYWSVTSGGCYPHWRDRFYPHRLPQSQWLSFYAQILATQPLKQGKPYVAQKKVDKSLLSLPDSSTHLWTDLRVWAERGDIFWLSGRASRDRKRLD